MADRCARVEPLRLDFGCVVKPAGAFSLENDRSDLDALWAQESTEAEGTPLLYWSQNLGGADLDPLYGEPIERDWHGPFELTGLLTWPEQTYEVREEGNRVYWTGQIWIARLSVEEAEMPEAPKEGDVVRVWDLPHFNAFAQGMESGIPRAGYFYDVVGVVDDGHVNDTADFAGFRCDLKRRTEFTPERRVFNQT